MVQASFAFDFRLGLLWERNEIKDVLFDKHSADNCLSAHFYLGFWTYWF